MYLHVKCTLGHCQKKQRALVLAHPFTRLLPSRFHFPGPCGTTLPPALARHETEIIS